jgi:hypothetical protein
MTQLFCPALPCPAQSFLCHSCFARFAGVEFEKRILANESANQKFNFLNATDPYHAYYRMRVCFFCFSSAKKASQAVQHAWLHVKQRCHATTQAATAARASITHPTAVHSCASLQQPLPFILS